MNKKVLTGVLSGCRKEDLQNAANMGVDYVDLHFGEDRELFDAVNEAEKLGIKVVINIEGRPLHWKPSSELRQYLEKSNAFLGFMLDECDHMQLNAHWPVVEYYGYHGQHYFAETDGMELDQAQEAVRSAIAKRTAELQIAGKNTAGEYLYPGMMHTACSAGLSASPKILKETCGTVMIAAGLGASLQYGGCFGIDCDAWWHPESVGHTDNRFASALRLAYWAGADRIYIEGGFGACGHPSEISQPRLMEHFVKDYIPSHERPYSWRDYRPEVAIIRQDDTCFDIRQKSELEYPGPLYGHIPAQEENTEWLNILNLLSHGYVRNDSASRNWECRSVGARILFAPFYKMVIFDENVTGNVLDTIRLFFLTGHKISSRTMEAVAEKVKAGAVCVVPPRFLPKHLRERISGEPAEVFSDGRGRWILVKDFYSLHYDTWTSGPCNKILRNELLPLIGDGNSLVYDFGAYTVKAETQKTPLQNGKIYKCSEIPRAVNEDEDNLVFRGGDNE